VNLIRPPHRGSRKAPAFTLVELLVVISIIAVLVTLSIVGISKFTEKGRSVQALSQFRSLDTAMKSFETEVGRPLLPPAERSAGRDTVYGDKGGLYSNDFVVAVLGGDAPTQWRGKEFAIKETSPRAETYLQLPFSEKAKNGVGKDGALYDPWGREVMIAVNGFKGPGSDAPLRDENGGENDRILETYRIGEYKETKPREQSFVFWSFGKDGKKGKDGHTKTALVPLAGSDDVVSWR